MYWACCICFCFFKQKTAYEMRISDWSSDVCSSDLDLRERVVAAMASGLSARGAAAQFGVSVASAVRWSQRHRRTGGVAPGKLGGHRKPVLLPERDRLLARAAAEPDLTLRGLLSGVGERGVKASDGASVAFPDSKGWSVKNKLFAR